MNIDFIHFSPYSLDSQQAKRSRIDERLVEELLSFLRRSEQREVSNAPSPPCANSDLVRSYVTSFAVEEVTFGLQEVSFVVRMRRLVIVLSAGIIVDGFE